MKFTLSIAFCDASHYVPLARAADQAGWASISVLEGLFYYADAAYAYPVAETGAPYWQPTTPYIDPFVAVAAMAREVGAKVLALSESPKTENVWYRAWAADPATGEDLGTMLMYLRYMKASSALYAD